VRELHREKERGFKIRGREKRRWVRRWRMLREEGRRKEKKKRIKN